MTATTRPPVCDLCVEAALEEVDDDAEFSRNSLAKIARDLGADIADHNCESTDSHEECGCACQRRARAARS